MRRKNYQFISTILWSLITIVFLGMLFSFGEIKETDSSIKVKIHKTIPSAEDM